MVRVAELPLELLEDEAEARWAWPWLRLRLTPRLRPRFFAMLIKSRKLGNWLFRCSSEFWLFGCSLEVGCGLVGRSRCRAGRAVHVVGFVGWLVGDAGLVMKPAYVAVYEQDSGV